MYDHKMREIPLSPIHNIYVRGHSIFQPFHKCAQNTLGGGGNTVCVVKILIYMYVGKYGDHMTSTLHFVVGRSGLAKRVQITSTVMMHLYSGIS